VQIENIQGKKTIQLKKTSFFFLVVLGFEPTASCTLLLQPLCQRFSVLDIFEILSGELFAGDGFDP
jgi:hypothetical protein